MRLAGQVKGGFYPAPPEAVAAAAKFLRPPKSGKFCILDPCAGQGAAIHQLAEALNCKPGNVYAIELEESRVEDVRSRMPAAQVLGPASFLNVGGSRSSSFAWINPPFDNELGGGGRVESTFLRHATMQFLKPDGVLALVIPESASVLPEVRAYLMSWYIDISLWRFPPDHRPYGEVVIFAVRRKWPVDGHKKAWARECGQPHVYAIPEGTRPARFEKVSLTDEEIANAMRLSPLRRMLDPPPDPPLPSPPMSLGKGHVALLLASGHLDGVVTASGKPPHVVRGVAKKIEYVSSVEQTENSEGEPQEVVTYSEKISMVVRTVSPCGTIKTFSQDPELEEAKR